MTQIKKRTRFTRALWTAGAFWFGLALHTLAGKESTTSPAIAARVQASAVVPISEPLAKSAPSTSQTSPERPAEGKHRPDADEKQAIKAVERLGGKVSRDVKAPGTPVLTVDLDNTSTTDADLKKLAGLKHLQVLSLVGTRVTDAGLRELAVLTELREMVLDGTYVSDNGLKQLTRQRQWRALSLAGTRVSDAGLKELAGQKQLLLLDIAGTRVGDAGLQELKGLSQLRWLWLSSTKITETLREGQRQPAQQLQVLRPVAPLHSATVLCNRCVQPPLQVVLDTSMFAQSLAIAPRVHPTTTH